MLLALIQQHPGTTLIVTPLSLLAQWEEELTSKTTMSYRVHYGDKKYKNTGGDFDAVNVVLTTCK
jgi:SNF2 family DNA or RNA helicase